METSGDFDRGGGWRNEDYGCIGIVFLEEIGCMVCVYGKIYINTIDNLDDVCYNGR